MRELHASIRREAYNFRVCRGVVDLGGSAAAVGVLHLQLSLIPSL